MIAKRAAAIRAHEDTLREILTEYFRARDSADTVRANAEAAADRVRREADARIAQLHERAERDASEFEQQAQAAVHRMLELGETRQAVMNATGLSAAHVRAAERLPSPSADSAEAMSGPAMPVN